MYPTAKQTEILLRWGNALRGIWNYCVREGMREWTDANRDHGAEGRWEDDGGPVHRRVPVFIDERVKTKPVALYKRTTNGPAWMQEVPSTMRAEAGQHMRAAWQAWRKTGRRPVFHGRCGRLSMSCQNVRFVDGDRVLLPTSMLLPADEKAAMTAPIRLAQSVGDLLTNVRPGRGQRDWSPARMPGWKGGSGDVATISFEAGEWHISFPVAEHRAPAPRTEQLAARGKARVPVIGVDANTHAYVCSDGTVYEIPKNLLRLEDGVRLAQQAVSRRGPGSNRHRRALEVLAKRKAKQTRVRKDWLNKITYDLATRVDVVVLEDLAVKNMTATAKGTAGDPGKNVASKAGLNRAMLNAAFATFRAMLSYKCAWYGSRLEVVPPHYTSQTCSSCGARKPMPLAERTYKCDGCGLVLDRDMNAAMNIRDKFLRGDAQVAPGASGEADGTGTRRKRTVKDQASRPARAVGGDPNAGTAGSARKGTVTPSQRSLA